MIIPFNMQKNATLLVTSISVPVLPVYKIVLLNALMYVKSIKRQKIVCQLKHIDYKLLIYTILHV